MFDAVSIGDKIQSELNYQCVCLKDLQLACGNRRDMQLLPAALVCESAIVVFVQAEPSERGSESLKIKFRKVLRALVEGLDVSVNSLIVCGCFSEPGEECSEVCIFNTHNERIAYFSCEEQFDDFLCTLIYDLRFRRATFEASDISDISFNLQLLTGLNGEVKRDADGGYYIKKHGHWYHASDLDPDETFKKAALFGAFGAHKLLGDRKIVGLFYFFTCGFFGIGWLFDCLTMILGIYKDGEGRYMLPMTSRKGCWIKLLIGFVVTIAYILLYVFIISSVGNLLNGSLNQVISSNSDSLSSLAEFQTP